MKKKRCMLIGMLCFILMFIIQLDVKADEVNIKFKRISGGNRYETAVEISKAGQWEKAWKQNNQNPTAILVSGENYYDDIYVGPLAKKYNAPILFFKENGLGKETTSELIRLNIKDVYLVGSKNIIPKAVEDELEKMNISVYKISMNSKTERCIDVARTVGSIGGIILVKEDQYADIISISQIGTIKWIPVILIPRDTNTIPNEVKEYIVENKIPKVYIIGNKESIDETNVNGLTSVERIEGKTAFERNYSIIQRFSGQYELDFSNIYICKSTGLVDSFVGEALAAQTNSPMVLAEIEDQGQLSKDFITFLSKQAGFVQEVSIFGGYGAFSKDAEEVVFSNLADINNNCAKANEYIQKGYECYKNKDYEGALKNYASALELNDGYADRIWNYRGIVTEEMGKYDVAIICYSASIKANPNNAYAYANRGQTYAFQAQYEEAIEDSTKALELDPSLNYAYVTRAFCYYSKDNYEGALSDINKGIQLEPNNFENYFSRAQIYKKFGYKKEAITDYKKCMELDKEGIRNEQCKTAIIELGGN